MKARTVGLLTKEGALNIVKNKLMSIASLITITTTLFILGLILMVIVNVTSNMESMKRSLQVGFYLKVDASAAESSQIANFIADSQTSGTISQYQHESKEQGYENATKDLIDQTLAKGLSPDNFAEGYFVKLRDPNNSEQFIAKLKALSGVDQNFITYPKGTLDKLTGMMHVFNYVSISLLVFLIIVSVFIISNTIRLTVYARRKEIEIMKSMGAFDIFIRVPFIIEGMLIGVLGTICSFILSSQTYNAVKTGLSNVFIQTGLQNLQLIKFGPVALRILLLNLIFGVTIGALGSLMSVRKHLNV